MNDKDRLLVVDDELAVRQYLADVGRRLGFEVATAANRIEFETKLPAFWPTVILLDLQMPDCDGIQMLKLIRDFESDARVVLVSGMDQRTLNTATSLGEILNLNMDGALQKPILIDTLRRKLKGSKDPRIDVDIDKLREAIETNAITPVYQPKIARDSSGRWAITEVEALARWHRDDSVVILPSEFIGIAEQSGLMPLLTQSMLRQVLGQLKEWDKRGVELVAAVNISPSLLSDSAFPDQLEEITQEFGLDNSRLVLELTESAVMQNAEIAMEVLSRVRIKNFGLAIDDFGTGYSSLEQLYRMPFNEIKIDRFLVRDINQRQEAATIVETIILLARKLNLSVCAEGVDSHDALAFLLEAGCDKFQGYYIGRPVSASALAQCVREFGKLKFESLVRKHEPHAADRLEISRVHRPLPPACREVES